MMDRDEYLMARDILDKTRGMVGSIEGAATSPGLRLALMKHRESIEELIGVIDGPVGTADEPVGFAPGDTL